VKATMDSISLNLDMVRAGVAAYERCDKDEPLELLVTEIFYSMLREAYPKLVPELREPAVGKVVEIVRAQYEFVIPGASRRVILQENGQK
jgi:hypothetical protein